MVAPLLRPYRPGVAATIVFRAFRLSTWRETAYLLLGGLVAIVAFVLLVTGVSVGLALVITLVGIPILAATALAARGIACGRSFPRACRRGSCPSRTGSRARSW